MGIRKQGQRDVPGAPPSLYSAITSFFLGALEKLKRVFVSWCEVHSSQTWLFLWDYELSQEVVIHSSVDTGINTMNMLAHGF